MTCDQSIGQIAAAIEGRVALIALDSLMAHLGQCPACRIEAETQFTIKRLLASRPDDALPDGFLRRLATRLDGEGTLGAM
jgi:hypothetical protein